MSVRFVQASELQHLAAEARSRRRSLPPSLSVSVSQSVNQRWRERPRCPASRVAPGRRDGVVHAIVGRAACRCPRAHVVQGECAVRVHVFVSRFAGPMRPMSRTGIGSCASRVSRRERHACGSRSRPRTHRAFDGGAVLDVVNALRFASTQPTAGPSGIDDASARHDLGYCAMAGFPMAGADREKRVDAGFAQAYVDVSRLCPNGTSSASHPVHAERVSSRRPQGTIQAPPNNIASGCYGVTLRVNRRAPDSRSHGLSSAHRLEGRASLRVAFTEAHARPGLG
jgi:hypothetical protein